MKAKEFEIVLGHDGIVAIGKKDGKYEHNFAETYAQDKDKEIKRLRKALSNSTEVMRDHDPDKRMEQIDINEQLLKEK